MRSRVLIGSKDVKAFAGNGKRALEAIENTEMIQASGL